MVQTVIESIVIAAAIVSLVATGYIYSPDPLGKTITQQIKIIHKR